MSTGRIYVAPIVHQRLPWKSPYIVVYDLELLRIKCFLENNYNDFLWGFNV